MDDDEKEEMIEQGMKIMNEVCLVDNVLLRVEDEAQELSLDLLILHQFFI